MSLWTLEYLTLNALLSLFNLSAARIWQCILLECLFRDLCLPGYSKHSFMHFCAYDKHLSLHMDSLSYQI